VNFGKMDGTIREPNLPDTLSLAPTALAIELLKPGNLANPRPNRKRLNLRDWAEQLEMHNAMVPKLHSLRQRER
jgi:hypothetical protein